MEARLPPAPQIKGGGLPSPLDQYEKKPTEKRGSNAIQSQLMQHKNIQVAIEIFVIPRTRYDIQTEWTETTTDANIKGTNMSELSEDFKVVMLTCFNKKL